LGNGQATLWRGLCGALARNGHFITFFWEMFRTIALIVI
jgi:hypothetical protein